jgi:uncharacterized phiE125 gp8 family phage protein
MMALQLVTPPANQPVTLTETKAHLVVEHDEHDNLIDIYIAASTGAVDGPRGFLGRALIDQTWDLFLDHFPGEHHHDSLQLRRHHHHHLTGQIEIPLPPLIGVIGVFYKDSSGAEQEFDADNYVVDTASQPGRVVLTADAAWPTTQRAANAVRVRFRAGYIGVGSSPPEDAVPFPIKAAILLHVGDLYRGRETMSVGQIATQLPWAAEQLLRPYRNYLGLA